MRRLLLMLSAAVVILGVLPTTNARAYVAQIYNYAASTYNGCQATISTPPAALSVAGTIKSVIQGKDWTDPAWSLQCGWKYSYGWTKPKSFHQSRNLLGQTTDYTKADLNWGTRQLYDIIPNTNYDFNYWMSHVNVGTSYTENEDWVSQIWYCGLRTSNAADKCHSFCGYAFPSEHPIGHFNLRRASDGAWIRNTVNNMRKDSIFANPTFYENYCDFLWVTNNW